MQESTVSQLTSTYDRYTQAVERLGRLQTVQRDQQIKYAEAERLVFCLSPKFKSQLEWDLRQRIHQIRALKIAKSRTKARLKKYEILKKKSAKRRTKKHKDYTAYLETKLQRIEKDIRADGKVCIDLSSRLRLATAENHTIAMEELETKKKGRDSAVAEFTQATKVCDEMQSKLLDEEAFIFRNELLNFIKSGKYAIEPRQIAKALAGLPYSTCRRSAERCASLSSTIPVSLNHQLFLFISSCWERRIERGQLPLIDWFRQEVLGLRKWFRLEGRKQGNPLRDRLVTDWYFLRKALEAASVPISGTIPKHYFIAQQFISQSLNPNDPLERIWAEQEKLSNV